MYSRLVGIILTALCLGGVLLTAAQIPADRPPDFVPSGAYLSWERTAANAAAHGIDQWEDVTRRLDVLEMNNINLLWVTNMSVADLPRLIEECGLRDMMLLPNMGAIEAKVDWRWSEGSTYYDQMVPSILKAAGDSPTLVGWVLSDEPLEEHFPRIEALRRAFREIDPDRFCTIVTMWPQTPLVPKATDLPVVCVDLYPFFAPRSPNGPHTDAASQRFFRRNAEAMITAIGDSNVAPWIMGMAFCEIWGPRTYDENGHLIALPGAYCHWRSPTPAEMRWQVWETLRVAARGFICYTVAPEAPREETALLPPADVEWKNVLVREPVDMGPNALTNPDCSETPQLAELGRVYASIEPYTGLILRWQMTDIDLIAAAPPGQVQAFLDPDSDDIYAIVLNDNLQQDAEILVHFGTGVTTVRDMTRDRDIPLTRDVPVGNSTGTLVLAAGEGTILRLISQDPSRQ